jgi:thiol-disulfide isomerase/thioredoxin
MSNYTHFSGLGYQQAVHPSQSRGMVNPLGRISPDNIEQDARDEQERRQREDQQRIEEERSRRKRASLHKLKEGFSEAFGGKMKSEDEFAKLAEDTGVLDLSQNSEEDLVVTLKKFPKSIVWFYAPWCGHCHSFIPVFRGALDELGDKVKFIIIDGDQNSDVARAYNVRGFPTLKFFTSKTATSQGEEYNGPRSVKGLTSFLQSQ